MHRCAFIVVLGALAACSHKNDNDLPSGAIRSVRNIAGTNAIGLDSFFDPDRNAVIIAALQSGTADYGRGVIGNADGGAPVLVVTRDDSQLQALWQNVLTANFTAASQPHVTIDSLGNVALAVSNFGGTVDLDQTSAAAPYVAEYAEADGTARWATTLGEDPIADPRFIVTDPSTDVVVASIVDNGTTSTAMLDRFTGAGGALVYSRPFGIPTGNEGLDGFAIDGDGNLMVAGEFDGSIRLSQVYTAIPSQTNGYVAKLGADSTKALWSRFLRLRDASQHVAIAALTNGDVVIGGEFAFLDDPTDTTNPLGPNNYLRLALLAGADGSFVWNTRTELPNTVALQLVDIADHVDDVLVSVNFSGTLQIGDTTAVSTSSSAMAFLKVAGDTGDAQWLRYSQTSSTHAGRVGLSGDGNPTSIGTFDATDTNGNGIETIYVLEVTN